MTADTITTAALALPPESRAALAETLLESLPSPQSAKGAAVADVQGAGANIAARFRAYCDQWKQESRLLSSSAKMAMLPSYQHIIGLGPAAISLILEELEREPNHWFWALEALTGADPVPAEARGNVAAMTDAWLAWGCEHGYLPA